MSISKSTRIVSLLTIILLFMTGYGIFEMRTSINKLHDADAERSVLQTLAKELQASSEKLTVAARSYAATGDKSFKEEYNRTIEIRAGNAPRPVHSFVRPGEKIGIMTLLSENGCTKKELAMLDEAANLSGDLSKVEEKVFLLTDQGKRDEALALAFSDEYAKFKARIQTPIDRFDDELKLRLNKVANDCLAEVQKNIFLLCICIVVNILLSFFTAFFTDCRVIKRLERTSAFANELASGNYSAQLSRRYHDEIGTMVDALNTMVDSLKAKISESEAATERAKLRQAEAVEAMKQAEEAKKQAERAKRDGMLQAADQLSGVVDAVSHVSKALNDGIVKSDKGAKEQAHLALETAGSMDEMKGAVNAVAHSASDAAHASSDVRLKAKEGVEQVSQVTASMGELSAASAKISEDMQALGKHADGIGAILSVISDIADQTNLLALNAAIEAARAGEAGRGFAVVADEVRKLAEKTMTATHEVSQAISTIQASVRTNISSVTATGEMAQNVTDIVQRSGEVLNEILHLAEVSADQVSAIAAASEEQSASGEHISKSVDTISEIANQTVDTMQEADVAVKELIVQSNKLSQLIDDMKRG